MPWNTLVRDSNGIIKDSRSDKPVTKNASGTPILAAATVSGTATTTGGSAYPFYDALIARDDLVKASSWRTQASIDVDARVGSPGSEFPEYDETADAAVQVNSGKNISPDAQLQPEFGPISSGDLFLTWDFWQGSEITDWVTGSSLQTHKFWTVRPTDDSDRMFEMRHRYSQADEGFIAKTDLRVYPGEGLGAPISDDPADQITQWDLRGDTWTRYFVYMSADRVAIWVDDEVTDSPVKTHDFNPDVFTGAPNIMRAQGNTSQSPSGPNWEMRYRNFVALADLDNTPDSIVASSSW